MSSDTAAHAPAPFPFCEWPDNAEIKTFKGRCHCGEITFEIDHPALETQIPMSCNCSYCTRTGAIYINAPISVLRVTSGEPAGFLSKVAKVNHQFCPSCGISLFWTGMGRASANVRTFEDVDVENIHIEKFDGARLLGNESSLEFERRRNAEVPNP